MTDFQAEHEAQREALATIWRSVRIWQAGLKVGQVPSEASLAAADELLLDVLLPGGERDGYEWMVEAMLNGQESASLPPTMLPGRRCQAAAAVTLAGMDSAPDRDGFPFMVLVGNGLGKSVWVQVSRIEGAIYPDPVADDVGHVDPIVDALVWAPCPPFPTVADLANLFRGVRPGASSHSNPASETE